MSDPGRDSFGDRIKAYEARETERRAMRGLPLVVRADGRSFSSFTKGMGRPWSMAFSGLMVETTKHLVEETHARVGYTQSDEISLIIDPWTGIERDGVGETQCLFDGRFQKLTSVIAAMATARFLVGALSLWPERCERTLPAFDCRVFEVPNPAEAVNAILWREIDATKNAISMAAHTYFSHGRLQNKNGAEMQEMLFQEHGINFNDYPAQFRRGTYVQRRVVWRELDPEQLERIPPKHRPEGAIQRSETICLDLSPLRKVTNRIAVLYDGADPILAPSPDSPQGS